jgi:hypothetical protein
VGGEPCARAVCKDQSLMAIRQACPPDGQRPAAQGSLAAASGVYKKLYTLGPLSQAPRRESRSIDSSWNHYHQHYSRRVPRRISISVRVAHMSAATRSILRCLHPQVADVVRVLRHRTWCGFPVLFRRGARCFEALRGGGQTLCQAQGLMSGEAPPRGGAAGAPVAPPPLRWRGALGIMRDTPRLLSALPRELNL